MVLVKLLDDLLSTDPESDTTQLVATTLVEITRSTCWKTSSRLWGTSAIFLFLAGLPRKLFKVLKTLISLFDEWLTKCISYPQIFILRLLGWTYSAIVLWESFGCTFQLFWWSNVLSWR